MEPLKCAAAQKLARFPFSHLTTNCSILTAAPGRTSVFSRFKKKFSALLFRTRIEHFSQVLFRTEHGCFVTVTVKISPVTCANQAKLQHHRNDFGPAQDD